MNNFNKNNVWWGIRVFSLFLFALLAIATCAGVWNSGYDSWVSWCAALLLIFVGVVIVRNVIKILQENPGDIKSDDSGDENR